MKTQREPFMIQIQFDDKNLVDCPLWMFKRRLKGTGIEVDGSYPPTRVGAGRFVGRGFVTPRVSRGLRIWASVRHPHVYLFEENRFDEDEIPELTLNFNQRA